MSPFCSLHKDVVFSMIVEKALQSLDLKEKSYSGYSSVALSLNNRCESL